ncbi:hypothetical protein RAMDARK_1367 [Rickettsia amblyommatis str. Darkwater]|uniref:Uncharacterized protein n=1 Tax=Rickettsia amblyommatis str. Ac/Pa TaxID=1359164 RepID=A0A0F3N754_RICAM|nr:hypothetical protein APHACPA_1787 [Rickettsia amblyommatis str. Ac/Pa]KJV90881.1 hypothetical protein RAMDARK_1367 [Rickettsia amblyommatis str. Darkwater]
MTPSALPVPATMPCEERSDVAISLKFHEIALHRHKCLLAMTWIGSTGFLLPQE